MALTTEKANKMKKSLYDMMDGLDPSGRNTEYYKSLFE